MRILIVRPTALGDVCRTVPALVTLRQAHRRARIDWLVNEPFVDAVRHHPALDQTIGFARSRFGMMWRRPSIAREAIAWFGSLRRQGYDLVFDFQGLARSGVVTWMTGARRRVGYANAREGAWLGYTDRHVIGRGLHTVDRMLGLLEAEGYQASHDMRLYTGEADRAWLTDQLDRRGIGKGAGYACLAPTAQWLCKCWPIDRYVDVARRLLEGGNKVEGVIVLAAEGEQRMIQPMVEAFSGDPRVWIPRTTIGQMMGIVQRARLVVCNDSAALHMAVGFDRPIVAIFGPTDPELVGPYRRQGDVLRPVEASLDGRPYRRHRDDQTLIGKLGVEEVWRAVASRLRTVSTPNLEMTKNGSNQRLRI